jgi:hypothetical protein
LRNLPREARVVVRPAPIGRRVQILDEVLAERGTKQRAVLLLSQ